MCFGMIFANLLCILTEWFSLALCRRFLEKVQHTQKYCIVGHSPAEVAAESEVGRDHLLPCCDDAAPAGLGSMERVVEQIVCAPVTQIMKDCVDGVQHVLLERVQKWDVEPIVCAPVPQNWEPVVEGVQVAPQERAQNRARELVVDLPVPQIKEEDVPVPKSWRNLGISFSVSKNEFWSRFHWCCGSWRKLGLLYSRCLRSVCKNQLWSRFLWCPRPPRKMRIASGSRS